MKQVDIRKLDFTLLSVLASLLRTRKATETAAELAMTQSTVSHALARLREILRDPLFLRRPHGLEPTPRALALAPQLEAIFDFAHGMLATRAFDPGEAQGIVRIAASDYHCALHAAPLIAALGAAAPKLRLSFLPLVRKQAVEALLAGTIDLAIGRFWALPRSVAAHELFDEDYSVVASRAAGEVGDLNSYLSGRHIVVSLDGDLTGVVDETLRTMGRRRNVVAATPYFLSALAAAAESAVIVTLPSRLATAYAPIFGLNVFSPPLALATFTVSEVVSASRANGDIVRWLFETVLPESIADAGPTHSSMTRRGNKGRFHKGVV